MSFSVAGVLAFFGCAIALLARFFQYRNFASGKYFKEYYPRSAYRELIFAMGAVALMFVGAVVLTSITPSNIGVTWIGAGVVLLIGVATAFRGAWVMVAGIATQARAFGIDTVRASISTGPLRIAAPLNKLAFTDFDTDDSLPD